MVVLNTCKWYQTACLVMTRRLVPTVTFLGQILKFTYLGHYNVCTYIHTMLLVMNSSDLNIDLTQKKFHTKVVGLSTNYPTSFAVCRYDSWFSRFDGGRNGPRPIPSLSEPARNRVNPLNTMFTT